jgi:hypothetical protein
LPIAGHLRLKVAIGKHSHQRLTLPLVVIDDEDPAGNRQRSWHLYVF